MDFMVEEGWRFTIVPVARVAETLKSKEH